MIDALRKYLFPRTIIKIRNGAFQYFSFDRQQWIEMANQEETANSFFGQQVLLVPESQTLFRLRNFPQDHVRESELAEAIQLDIQTWSPWDNDYDYYYWPVRAKGQWLVAVWIWERGVIEQLAGDPQLVPTHIMPERAWKIAAIDNSAGSVSYPALYVDTTESEEWCYALLDETGLPQQLNTVADEQSAQRFWRNLDGVTTDYPVLVPKSKEPLWLPNEQRQIRVSQALPKSSALRHARQEGVNDWLDPFSWFKPLGTLAALYLIWLLGSSLILWQQGQAVNEQVDLARSAASDVIAQRDSVTRIHQKLQKLYRLRADQAAFEKILALLSQALPDDAWLDAIQYDATDGGWVDISGKAKQSAGLAAVLEALPEIEHAMFLNDIRKDKQTGLEPFKIRLKLMTTVVKSEKSS